MTKSCSILVVDDEPDNFDVIETFLNNQDYQLHYVASGQEAITLLETFQPDLILLDVMMPGIDGIETCRQIKALTKWQAVPIIIVTALSTKSDLALCINAGADDFISKPVNAIELRARVHSMLRIKQQYDQLQSLLKAREDMVNMLVHDLRNPLSSILLNLELLVSIEYPPEKQYKKLNQIHSSAKSLQGLIDNLLKIALIEAGKINLNLTDVDLGELIQSVIAKFDVIAAKKNHLLVSQLPNISTKKVSVDVNMMHRVLENLLSNAIKFSPQDTEIIVNLEFLDSGHARIQVIDYGQGVSEPLQQKIFEKYEIGTLMPEISQIGLGLAFCKMAIEAHRGNICVRNNQPQGSIFEITLAA